jgi:hypothetical protein
VVEALKENAFLNELHDENRIHSSVLRWGRSIVGSWVEEDFAAWPYDVVIGADIVRSTSVQLRPNRLTVRISRHMKRWRFQRWRQAYACFFN